MGPDNQQDALDSDARTPGGAPLADAMNAGKSYDRFVANLQLLNDVLAQTALAERYWLWGGVLLGWAREGRLLGHDAADADFGILAADESVWLAATPALAAAGFRPYLTWTNSKGVITEYVLKKDQAHFDFFLLFPEGAKARYWLYAPLRGKAAYVELEGVVVVNAFSTMRFLERSWRKPADHDAHLTEVYGDWRTPNPHHNYVVDERSIVSRRLWVGKGVPIRSMPDGQSDFGVVRQSPQVSEELP